MLTNKRFRRFLLEFNQIVAAYHDSYVKKKVNWVEYEREYKDRIRYVSAELNNIVDEASSFIIINKSNRGRYPKLTWQKKAITHRIKGVNLGILRSLLHMLLLKFLVFMNMTRDLIMRIMSLEKLNIILFKVFYGFFQA